MVFTETALALSETFIAAHCRSLERYRYTLVAIEKSGDSHADIARTILVGPGMSARWERLLFRLGINRKMDTLISKLQPDIIHAHYMMGGAFMLPYARRHNIPLVVTGHGYDVTRRLDPASSYGILYAFWRRVLIKSESIVLPVSDYLRANSSPRGFASRRPAFIIWGSRFKIARRLTFPYRLRALSMPVGWSRKRGSTRSSRHSRSFARPCQARNCTWPATDRCAALSKKRRTGLAASPIMAPCPTRMFWR